jgi:hypothetical protein
MEVTGSQGRRRRKLLDDLKERRGYSHLKDEALDRTVFFQPQYCQFLTTVLCNSN